MLIPLVLWHMAYTKKVPEKRFISPLMPGIEVGVFSLVQDKIKGAFEEEKETAAPKKSDELVALEKIVSLLEEKK